MCLCLWSYTQTYIHVCACIHMQCTMCSGVWGGQRSTSSVIFGICPSSFVETGSLSGAGTCSVGKAGWPVSPRHQQVSVWWVPGLPMHPPYSAFDMSAGRESWVIMFARKAFYWVISVFPLFFLWWRYSDATLLACFRYSSGLLAYGSFPMVSTMHIQSNLETPDNCRKDCF